MNISGAVFGPGNDAGGTACLVQIEAGILRETTGGTRNRLYRYDENVNLFEAGDAIELDHTLSV